MQRIRSLLAALCATLTPAAVFAQDTVADAADTFATVYLIGGGVVLFGISALLGWGANKLTDGALQIAIGRFLTVFDTGLKGFHAEFKRGLEAARDPDSPGGVVITDDEWQGIKDSMWRYLKHQYGSFDGIAKVVGRITGANSAVAVTEFVDSKIHAGIAELERADKATAARDPSTP